MRSATETWNEKEGGDERSEDNNDAVHDSCRCSLRHRRRQPRPLSPFRVDDGRWSGPETMNEDSRIRRSLKQPKQRTRARLFFRCPSSLSTSSASNNHHLMANRLSRQIEYVGAPLCVLWFTAAVLVDQPVVMNRVTSEYIYKNSVCSQGFCRRSLEGGRRGNLTERPMQSLRGTAPMAAHIYIYASRSLVVRVFEELFNPTLRRRRERVLRGG